MMRPALRFPEDARDAASRKYQRLHQEWLTGAGAWPLEITLGAPSEAEAQSQGEAVRAWVAAWHAWTDPGELVWTERRWRTLGPQKLPERLLLRDPRSVAAISGEEHRWIQAASRYRQLEPRWPGLSRYFDVLADYPDRDIQRLEALLTWIAAHPQSDLYPRQIPLPGLDTKWLQPRLPMVADLIGGLGLKDPPHLLRFRILDPVIRDRLGGLGDIATPAAGVAALQLPPARVYIVENLQTGLAFDDLPGAVVFMGLGWGVSSLSQAPWVTRAECTYWGDLDTHGFAILNLVRSFLPGVKSVLMDEATLLRNRDLWVEEKEQWSAPSLPLLNDAEQAVYQGLKQQRWGRNVRLEQERIAWNEAWAALRASAEP